MKIGTPLSPFATKVMLLGAGELGKEVIISFQRLGIEVIAVDRYNNAPGQQVAHRSYVIDMTNESELREVIQKENPDYIVPEIEAINTEFLSEVVSEGQAKVFPSLRAVQLTMNREGIRKLASEELGLPTSNYGFARSCRDLKNLILEKINFPCFVKPTMSSSGKGQSLVRSESEIESAWNYAASGGRVDQGIVIAESLIDFDYEITLLTVRSKDSKGNTCTKFCDPIGHLQENGDYIESFQPQPMSKKALDKSKNIAKLITDALGGLGIFGVELFVKKDDVWFSEVSPRPHDTGMVTMASQTQSEFELHAKAILGLPVDTSLLRPGASKVIYGDHDADEIYFEGVDQALQIPGIDIRLFGKPKSFKKRRMGVILASSDTVKAAINNAKKASSKIKTKIKA
ncbi:formate-dependent phosphoribosylglycinamide formyltransferase [Methylophilaceae bacterium]|jgi:phosphoribosylglycinamide formyltransferase 2|nr:formate-dependent phosphoribosylglycinamide formyltransferase [Methylophilaceae bacterium]|tara:strand:- start:9394 stop:10596 length:1203 start_codon:yes stop_codon:yes gene_type:complete